MSIDPMMKVMDGGTALESFNGLILQNAKMLNKFAIVQQPKQKSNACLLYSIVLFVFVNITFNISPTHDRVNDKKKNILSF